MKNIITFALLHLSLIGFSQEKKNMLYFIYNPSECQNCITEELNLSLTYYRMFPSQVFFVVENNAFKQKLHYLLGNLDFKVSSESILVDEVIYKKYVKHPLQICQNGKFSAHKLTADLPSIFKMNLEVAKADKTVTIPKRLEGFRYNFISDNPNEIKLFYDEIGIICSTTDTINLANKIDTVELISALHLSKTDTQLTFNEIKNKKTVIHPLFQIVSPVKTSEKNFYYFTTIVTYSHLLTIEEIRNIQKLKNGYGRMLKNADKEGITTYKNELFLSKFDLNYNYIESYMIADPTSGYGKDYRSAFYKNGSQVVGNLHGYKTDSIKKHPFPTYGHYLLGGDSIIQFMRADNFNKPDFYKNEGFDNNCANTEFSKVDSSIIYYYVSYPCAIDITNHTRYEIPMKDIKNITKLEKQPFNNRQWIKYYTLGLMHLQNGVNILLFRSYQGEQIYYGIFNEEGNYFGFGKLEQKIPMKATTTLNGELINILENEIQYLQIDIKE